MSNTETKSNLLLKLTSNLLNKYDKTSSCFNMLDGHFGRISSENIVLFNNNNDISNIKLKRENFSMLLLIINNNEIELKNLFFNSDTFSNVDKILYIIDSNEIRIDDKLLLITSILRRSINQEFSNEILDVLNNQYIIYSGNNGDYSDYNDYVDEIIKSIFKIICFYINYNMIFTNDYIENNECPLMFDMVYNLHPKIFKYLLINIEYYNFNFITSEGENILTYNYNCCYYENIEFLLQNKKELNINFQNYDGNTLLTLLSKQNNEKSNNLMKIIINNNYIKNNEKKTIIHYLMRNNNFEMVYYIEKYLNNNKKY